MAWYCPASGSVISFAIIAGKRCMCWEPSVRFQVCMNRRALRMKPISDLVSIVRLIRAAHRQAARLLFAAGVLASAVSGNAASHAAEIAILKSSSIAAYDQAITGFKSTAPSGVFYSEYDVQGDLEQGRKL